MMACRNIKTCFLEAFLDGASRSDEVLEKYVKQCQDMCTDATGLNKVMSWANVDGTVELNDANVVPQDARTGTSVVSYLGAGGTLLLLVAVLCRSVRNLSHNTDIEYTLPSKDQSNPLQLAMGDDENNNML